MQPLQCALESLDSFLTTHQGVLASLTNQMQVRLGLVKLAPFSFAPFSPSPVTLQSCKDIIALGAKLLLCRA